MRAGRRNLCPERSFNTHQREAGMTHMPPVSRLIIQESDDHPDGEFRPIFEPAGSDPGDAITFAGWFLPIAGICLMWIHAPQAEELTEIPMVAAHAHH